MHATSRITIVRADHNKSDGYFIDTRKTAQDRTISYEASGVHRYLLSKPNGWQLQPADLERPTCKRDKVYRILKELVHAGYIVRTAVRDEKGKYTNVQYTVYETPQIPTNHTETQPFTENPYTAEPDTVFPHVIYNRTLENIEKHIPDPLDQAQPNPQTPSTKRTKSELNANYDLIAELWYARRVEKPSAMIVNLCGLLFHDRNGKGEWKTARPTTPLTHDEARAFAKWAKSYANNSHLNGELPTSPVTLQAQISAFRAQSQPKPIAARVPSKPVEIDHAQYIASLLGDQQ